MLEATMEGFAFPEPLWRGLYNEKWGKAKKITKF
jgi:hypothetical protein